MSGIFFADLDPAKVEANVLTTYENIAQTTLYPGDPVRLFLESLAYLIALQNNAINLAGRQNLLAFAEQAHLDEIGKMVGTPRLTKSRARLTQRFDLDEPQAFAVVVPAGTRVTTADARRVFATDADLIIPSGATCGDITATAGEHGAALNGLLPGQVNRLIDPLPYVQSTSNVTASAAGADVEDDARYRERIQEAPEAFTCAGPVGSYRALARAVHQDIAEVAVWSPQPGRVDVRPVMQGGELPSEELLEALRRTLSAEDVRPLTDTVTVAAPELVPFEIRASWSLARGDSALAGSKKAAVEAAVERYRLWQRGAPGRDINPTRLISLMQQAGARRVTVEAPEYAVLEPRQLARESSVTITFLGVEDE
ncbi:baseplate J/gp47 family protein [Desulfovibrio sp. ZJ200]|uniref:baseplate assembly protein n=1 Tax=Desulfovibrio sp. ZJ200 TaxID=2709792 RepID=UPI0013EA8431|nr:baseplate J/gp47 family protein [Desulfovibrio sp. ZJ200]